MSDVWIVHGTTESGDDWSLVFGFKPEREDIETEIMKDEWLREEYEANCILGWTTVHHLVIQD